MSTASPEKDLLSRSRDFRRDMLTSSGGWLHDIVTGASSVTGLSDYFLLGVIFVGSWCILRLAEREVALILALGFDLTIPLQHSPNPRVKEKHRQHMESYWPVFFTGAAIEFACLLFVHPTMFTLVVCLKTTVCTAMWFYQGPSAAAAVSATGSRSKTSRAANDAPSAGGDTTAGKEGRPKSEPSEMDKQVQKIASKLREKGYKSDTACREIARQILGQDGEKSIQAMLKRRLNATDDEKKVHEETAKATRKKREEGEKNKSAAK